MIYPDPSIVNYFSINYLYHVECNCRHALFLFIVYIVNGRPTIEVKNHVENAYLLYCK